MNRGKFHFCPQETGMIGIAVDSQGQIPELTPWKFYVRAHQRWVLVGHDWQSQHARSIATKENLNAEVFKNRHRPHC